MNHDLRFCKKAEPRKAMNRLFLALLLIASFAITNQAFAQVRLGVKAGVNTSNIHFNLFTSDPI